MGYDLLVAAINVPIKFELSISTDYEDMKGYTKSGKQSGFR